MLFLGRERLEDSGHKKTGKQARSDRTSNECHTIAANIFMRLLRTYHRFILLQLVIILTVYYPGTNLS